MSLSLPARRYFFRTPPRASQLGLPGAPVVLLVGQAPGVLNLQTLYAQSGGGYNAQTVGAVATNAQRLGVRGQRILIISDVDLGIITGAVISDVTGANAPSLDQMGSVDASGNYTGTPGSCTRFPAGMPVEFEITDSIATPMDVFLGFVGATSGRMDLYQLSGVNA